MIILVIFNLAVEFSSSVNSYSIPFTTTVIFPVALFPTVIFIVAFSLTTNAVSFWIVIGLSNLETNIVVLFVTIS